MSHIEEYKLNSTPQGIDECSDLVRKFLVSINQSSKDALRYSLTIEDVLVQSFDVDDKDIEVADTFVLRTGKRWFRYFVELDISGDANNVYIDSNKDGSILVDNFVKNLNVTPEYGYSDETNIYIYKIKKKKLNPFILLAIALLSAVIVGLAGNVFIEESLRTATVTSVLVPLHDTFLNILGCVAGPMIFLSVAWGIYGIGDAATFKQVGSKLLGSYLLTLFVATAITTVACIPVFSPDFSVSKGSSSAAGDIFSMLLGFFPANIFSPFVDGNTLQIIFLGIIVGIALMFLGRRTKEIAVIIEQINLIVQFLIEVISALVPYFIFIVLLEMLWSDNIGVIASVSKLCIVFVLCVFVFAAFMVTYTAARNRVNPILLFKKGLPTLATGLTTASSAACFGLNLVECEKELGIDEKITSFGLPVGMVAFKGATAINYVTMALFFATLYDVKISVSWVVILILTAAILAVSTPPIPGGAASAYAVLMTQMGIPSDALAIALAVDVLFDFVATGTDQFVIPYALLNEAGKLGLVNRKLLLKKK